MKYILFVVSSFTWLVQDQNSVAQYNPQNDSTSIVETMKEQAEENENNNSQHEIDEQLKTNLCLANDRFC